METSDVGEREASGDVQKSVENSDQEILVGGNKMQESVAQDHDLDDAKMKESTFEDLDDIKVNESVSENVDDAKIKESTSEDLDDIKVNESVSKDVDDAKMKESTSEDLDDIKVNESVSENVDDAKIKESTCEDLDDIKVNESVSENVDDVKMGKGEESASQEPEMVVEKARETMYQDEDVEVEKMENEIHDDSLENGKNNNEATSLSEGNTPEKREDLEKESEKTLQNTFASAGESVDEAEEKQKGKVGNRELVAPLHMLRGGDKEDRESAKMVNVEEMEGISKQLKRNAGTRSGAGLPTTVAVQSKSILIGTSRGLILVFNHYQELKMILGHGKRFKSLSESVVASETTFGPVSAIDIAPGSDSFLCGFANGRIEYWDLERGVCLKVLADCHSNAVTFLKFLTVPDNSQTSLPSSKKYTALSIDLRGVVMLLSISKVLMMRVVDSKCVLDGAAGQILAFSNCEMEKAETNLVSLSTIKDTYMVSIQAAGAEAKVSYVWHLKGEDKKQEGFIPTTSWAKARLGEGRESLYTMARGWGNELQFLQYINNEFIQAESFPLFSRHGSSIMTVEWLQSDTLGILNDEYELCIFDVISMTLVEKISTKNLQLVWTSFSDKRHSFHSSFVAQGFDQSVGMQNCLFLLGIKSLSIAKVQTWSQRVESLVSRGSWLHGLALALDQYQLNGHREQGKMAEIIIQYATLSGDIGTEAAGACIEYCLEIERTDVLFGTVYECFVNMGKHKEFLEVLEPYILNRLVIGIGPLVLKDFVEHYQSLGKIREVEECLTHLDPGTIRSDLDTLVKLSKKYGLWSALIYLYNTGLNDWESPIRLLLKASDIDSEVRIQMILKAMDSVNTDEELWESQILNEIQEMLPQNEAVTITCSRLEKRAIPGGVSKEIVGKVLTRLLIKGEEDSMVKVLNNCDIGMYEVDEITTHVKAYGWNKALQTIYNASLDAAVNSGQSLQRIEQSFIQAIEINPSPLSFCKEKLKQANRQSPLVLEALKNAIIKSLKLLERYSSDETCKLINEHEDVISDPSQLDSFPLLQYEYMKCRPVHDHALFIRLLAKLDPERVYDYISSNDGMYPLDETLQVCKSHNIKDAVAYLLERTGDLDGALDLILECIDEKKDKEMSFSTESQSFEHAVEVAIQMCERNSVTNLDTEKAQKMWFRLLERLIIITSSISTTVDSKMIGNGETSDKSTATIALRNVLNRMMVHVESKNILKLIRNKPFGVLKKTVKAMIDAKYLENNMLRMASRLIANDMLHLVKAKHEKLNRAQTLDKISKTADQSQKESEEENIQIDQLGSYDSVSTTLNDSTWYVDWDAKLNTLGSTVLQLDPPI